MLISANRSVGIFCGAAEFDIHPAYLDMARKFGAALGSRGLGLVCGASSPGLVGAVADAAYNSGAKVTSIIPLSLLEKSMPEMAPGEIFVVKSIHHRRVLMHRLSDGFVALPGGYGTIGELLEAISTRLLGLHQKPVVALNFRGFYDPLGELVDHVAREGFISTAGRNAIVVASDVDEALDVLVQRCSCADRDSY